MENDADETQTPGDDSLSPAHSSPPTLVVDTSVTGGSGVTSNRSGRGGGRDDIWSDEATKVLIEAWGDRISERGKGALKQQHWIEVAEIVNKSGEFKIPRTGVQCRNRIDTVKKKYKQEKAKIEPSDWPFFKKLETLIAASKGTQRDAKRSAFETESESKTSSDSVESLPRPQRPRTPLFQVPKRLKMDKKRGESGVGELAKAIHGFAETYEKTETEYMKLMVELEKERMEFAKGMELLRMRFLKSHYDMLEKNQEEEEERMRQTDH